jgi:hypothetical protein
MTAAREANPILAVRHFGFAAQTSACNGLIEPHGVGQPVSGRAFRPLLHTVFPIPVGMLHSGSKSMRVARIAGGPETAGTKTGVCDPHAGSCDHALIQKNCLCRVISPGTSQSLRILPRAWDQKPTPMSRQGRRHKWGPVSPFQPEDLRNPHGILR